MRAIFCGIALLLPALAAGQPCPGDMNGDRRVTVAELVAAVNAALEGCDQAPTPTPLPQPCSFAVPNMRPIDPVCTFTLPAAARRCPGAPIEVYTDGAFMVLRLEVGDAVLYYGARVNDAGTATLMGEWTVPNLSDFAALTGRVTSSGSRRLNLGADGGCNGSALGQGTIYPERSAIAAMIEELHTR